MGKKAFQPSEGNQVKTTDKEYADTLARLHAIPATQPQRSEVTQAKKRARLVEDLMAINGEATW